jgi:solute carrier family 25 (mitochondrial carnitine/acylcarnitine transporter), member 20/29
MQTGSHSGGLISLATSYGGFSSLFRGMAAPLSTACVVNAIIFSSYGWSSRVFDENVQIPTTNAAHDSTIKAFTCGSFAGFVQGLVVCPMEHFKCRLQVQHTLGSPDSLYKGPVQVARSIYAGYGITGMFSIGQSRGNFMSECYF